VKRLLDGVVISKISARSTPVVIDLATENSQGQSSNDVVTSSSLMLKRHEEAVKKSQGTSPDPILPNRASSALQVPGGQQTDKVTPIFILSIVLIRSCDCCIRIGNQSVQTLNFSILQCTGDILV
jgi:hypothetical protein